MTDRATERIRDLERLVLELEGEVRALSGDCLLAYRERDHARELACRLQAEYEHAAGAWGPGSLEGAAAEMADWGIAVVTGPEHYLDGSGRHPREEKR